MSSRPLDKYFGPPKDDEATSAAPASPDTPAPPAAEPRPLDKYFGPVAKVVAERVEHNPVLTVLDAASDGLTFGLDKDVEALVRSEPTHEAARAAIQKRRDDAFKENPTLYRMGYWPAVIAGSMLPTGWLGRGAKAVELILPNANIAKMALPGATARTIVTEGAKAGAKTGALEGFGHADGDRPADSKDTAFQSLMMRATRGTVDAGTSAVLGGGLAYPMTKFGNYVAPAIERAAGFGTPGAGDAARAFQREGQPDVVNKIKKAVLPADVGAVTALPARTTEDAAERAAVMLRELGGDAPTNAHVTAVRRAIEADPDWHRAFGPGSGSDRVGADTLNKKIRAAHGAFRQIDEAGTEAILRDYGQALGSGQVQVPEASARQAAAQALAARDRTLTPEAAETLVNRAIDAYREKNAFPAQLHELVAVATGGEGRATHKLYKATANLEGDGTAQSLAQDWVHARQTTQGGRVNDTLQRHLGDGNVEAAIEAHEAAVRSANADYAPLMKRPDLPDGLPTKREFELAETLGSHPDPEALLGGRVTPEARQAWLSDPKNAADYRAATAQADVWDRVAAARASGMTDAKAAKLLKDRQAFDDANTNLSASVQEIIDKYTKRHAGKQTSLARGVDAGTRTLERRNIQTFLEGNPNLGPVPAEVEAMGEEAVGRWAERQIAKQFARDGKPGPKIAKPVQSLEEFSEARRDLWQEIEASKATGKPTPLTRELRQLYDDVTAAASRTHPEWAKVNAARAAPEKLREAYELGAGINFNAARGKSLLDYTKQLRAFERMGDEQKAMFRMGLAGQLKSLIDRKSSTHNMAGPFQNERVQELLRRVLGPDEAGQVIDHFTRVGLATRTAQATKGSPTAPLLDMKSDMSAIGRLANALQFANPLAIIGSGLQAADNVVQRRRYDAVTDILTRNTDNPHTLLEGLDAIERATANSQSQLVRTATDLTARAPVAFGNRVISPFVVDNNNEKD